jgi:glycosyltransferase involved in cell wall biosynthesis
MALLGRLTARIDRLPEIGERLVAIGWPIGVEGRKHRAGSALLDDAGVEIAVAAATWIEIDETIPVAVQISADHYGKYDAATRADIVRLKAIPYRGLALIDAACPPDAYAALFPGSICLQPYDRTEFSDRVSGVTQDAFAGACPVVATAGTWTAERVVRFDAGIALAQPDAQSLYAAVRSVRDDYARYQAGAAAAGSAQVRDSWTPLLELLRA